MRRLLAIGLFTAYLVCASVAAVASAHTARQWEVRRAICHYWQPCDKALRVAWCESRWDVWARNGQYLGLFQMGQYARGRYGHAWNAWAQSRAAHSYYRDAGWRPWACG